ncbi:MAG TPA: alr0857 family protein [Trichocoleus sp.]|jgi:hypothetical protein
MLKLNYTEIGLYMEQTVTNPELLIAQRVLLAMRLGRLPQRGNCFAPLHVQPGQASFLLPANIPELEVLEMALQREYSSPVTLIPVDEEFVEVGLSGSWIAESKEAHEGMFLAVTNDQIEQLIYKLWQMSEAHISTLA